MNATIVNACTVHALLGKNTGWARKNGPFLKVCNSCI